MTESLPVLRRMASIERNLPDSLAATEKAWEKTGTDAANLLGKLLDVPVELHSHARELITAAKYKKQFSDPGLLVPLLVSDLSHFYGRMSSEDALLISELCLKAVKSGDLKESIPNDLDGELVKSVIDALTTNVRHTFDLHVEVSKDIPPRTTWPFQLTESTDNLLVARFSFAVGEEARISIDLTLPPDAEALHFHPLTDARPNTKMRAQIENLPLQLAAIVAQRDVKPDFLTHLKQGQIIALEGHSLETITLGIGHGDNASIVAEGEHGRVRGFQSVRITQMLLSD